MQWLNTLVDELLTQPSAGEGPFVVSSGVSPSGKYHLGTLREVLTAEAIARELRRRGHQAEHIHVADDLDFIRKVPVGIPESYAQYLGKPLCDIPAPDGSDKSYADYYLQDLQGAIEPLHLEVTLMRAHEKYRAGFFTEAIETTLNKLDAVKQILANVSGHQVNDDWSPIQVLENGYLKNRPFVSIDTGAKTLVYRDGNGAAQTTRYDDGSVKLNWRIDWPARWSLLHVQVEPFGRDHATKGGSYDTGKELVREIFGGQTPLPVPYNFINRSGETKKMSKSAGETITLAELLEVLPPELIWYFILRFSPDKQLFFDDGPTLMRLFDDFGALLAKPEKTASEQQLLEICLYGVKSPTVSSIPFTLLVASYQAALLDVEETLRIIGRTEYSQQVSAEGDTIRAELRFIDAWLRHHAPDEVRFALRESLPAADDLNDEQRKFLRLLAEKVAQAPENADGGWFHDAIYECKDSSGLAPKLLFQTLYQVLIGKDSGPRAGWFLSLLPRDWLLARLKLEA